MINRIYVHNYRCLVNFELGLNGVNLLLGPNGSGKSTLFDLLHLLSRCVSWGDSIESLFRSDDLTRWSIANGDEQTQRFELDLEGNGGSYRYVLEVEHRLSRGQARIGREQLLHEGKNLYEFSAASGKANLYRDDYSSGGEYLFDWSRSGISTLQERPENTKLVWFRKQLSNLFVIRPNPANMGAECRKEERYPNIELTNFAAWYRFLSQERQGQVMDLNGALREIIPDFDYLRLVEAGEAKILKARFKNGDDYNFRELSDGQRMIIVLYTLLHCLPEDGTSTLCIDEPENFLALSEIQPWLDQLDDRCAEGELQSLLITHHPRPINFLARDAGVWLDRSGVNQPTRVRRIEEDAQGVSMAHLIERGWIYDA